MSLLNNYISEKTPLVSIIIVNYNGLSYIDGCLFSILSQEYPNYEIIFVDNASNDKSFEYVRHNYPQIKAIQTSKNLGYFGACKEGIKNIKGYYLAFLNTDIEVDKKWLIEMVNVLESDSKIALTTPKILMSNNRKKINTCGLEIQFTGIPHCRGFKENEKKYNKLQKIASISGCSFIIAKNVLEKIGNLDENFFMYYEDIDLSWRAQLTGYNIVFVPSSVVYHDYSFNLTPQKFYYLERNRHMTLLKNLHLKTIFFMIPSLILTEFIVLGFAILKGLKYIKNKINAYGWIIKNFNSIWKKRQRLQNMRKINDNLIISRFIATPKFDQLISNNKVLKIVEIIFAPIFNILYKITLILI
jgi:hypothetical protein